MRHTAIQCNTLQHPSTLCNTLQHCSALQHTATPFNTVLNGVAGSATPFSTSTLQHSTLQHPPSTLCHSCSRCWARNALQHTATHCNTLQHTLQHPSTLCHSCSRCWARNALQRTATHCNTRVTLCNTLWRFSRDMCCSVLQSVAVCCSVLQCVAVCCYARFSREVALFPRPFI